METGRTVGTDVAGYFVEEPDEEMAPVFEDLSPDEAMSLEDILMTILVEVPLPFAGRIPVDNKGKEILVEKDLVKGNPVEEQIMLVLADIECLLNLRKKVIDEVEQFFYSFSLKRLSNLMIDESYLAKEELVLTWAEAESMGVPLNRKRYILLKYREMLLRKFLEARRVNFTPGDGSSAVDLKILHQLSDIHSFVLEELKKETQAHDLTWKKTCCSKIFEGRPRDRGAVIARTNTNTPSRCWIRTMLFVDGVCVGDNGGSGSRFPGVQRKLKIAPRYVQYIKLINKPFIGRLSIVTLLASRRLAPTRFTGNSGS
ncbi:TIR-NBS-LRR class disease resistance protein [Dorcoceras hygrometricum]|uniref:TIR-NBS-LRR class disease resistance protein n=1 Tax=Dorcoceras hygrometricum TaxID=472368 RepID=A0A2Z7D091_9LAMI|nr:TIR-NBS-LRR class disease resistance protein [Dorcoceras hygrometricum]